MAKKLLLKKFRSSTSSPDFSSSNWACLQEDLLASIVDKFVHLSDYIRFSAVCKSWNSMALSKKERCNFLSKNQLPWLLVSSEQQRLYNFSRDEISNVKIRIPYKYKNKNPCGSSHGWLIFIDHKNNNESAFIGLTLLNPLSGGIIHLPAIFKKLVGKFVLSRNPCLGYFEVFVISRCGFKAAHLEFGDKFWTYTRWSRNIPCDRFLCSSIFYKDHILCASRSGKIFSFGGNASMVEKIKGLERYEGMNYSSHCFLVETTNGDLLAVLRYCLMDGTFQKYKIFKTMESLVDQIPVESLGGESLFLEDYNNSIPVLASNYPGCRRNSIYYCYSYGGIEEYNLEDQSVQVHEKFHIPHKATWLVPSVKFKNG